MIYMNKYWFKPKKYGYGAYPSSIEGWVFVFVSVLVALAIGRYLGSNLIYFYSSLIALLICCVVISYRKTDGVWKWRWG